MLMGTYFSLVLRPGTTSYFEGFYASNFPSWWRQASAYCGMRWIHIWMRRPANASHKSEPKKTQKQRQAEEREKTAATLLKAEKKINFASDLRFGVDDWGI